MARIHADDPGIDDRELEARVERAIAARRGSRFTDSELQELRDAKLTPRLRRADLPRGLVGQLQQVGGRVPDVPAAPAAEPVHFGQTRDGDLERASPTVKGLSAALHDVQRGGMRGRIVGALRRLMRPFYKATLNLDHVLGGLESGVEELAARDDRYLDYLEARLERSLDLLKDDLDRRIDRTADWAGSHLSGLGGQLDSRRERQLHLLHNLVYELSDARLEIQQLEDRLRESMRRLAMIEERQRTLEKLALGAEGAG